jgi:PAS domain S-box-containing protein
MKTARIRLRVLVPLVTALALLLAAFVVTVNSIQDRDTTDRVAKKLNSVKELYKTQLDSDASMLAAALRVILSNERMKEALRARDRKALLEWGTPLSEELRVNHKITHFYFQGPDRVNILRFYKPEKYGDTINRFTTLEAQRTGQLTYGVELGALGTFTLRAVSPCYDNGQLLGYIELGEEIDHIAQKLHEVLGVNIFVAIEKEHVDRKQWETGMQVLGRDFNWDQFSDVVIVSQTKPTFPMELAPFLSKSQRARESVDVRTTADGLRYRCKFLPLTDASGREVGAMVVAIDVTEAIAAANRSSLVVSGVCVLVGGALFVLFYFFLGRVERQLVAAHQELEQWGKTLEHKVEERTRELKEEIAERKKAEEALWESQQRYQAIVENTVLGITIMDTNYKIIMTNATFANLFRKSPGDFVGKYCFREYERREAVCPHCPGKRAMVSGNTEEVETHAVLDDGTYVYVRNRAIPLFGSDGVIKGFIEMVENITERKQAEKEKEKLQVQLLQSEKMAAVGQLAGGVAHEINNPLSVILGFAQGVAKRINAGDPLEMPLKSIEREAKRCKKIVQDLLTFSRSQKKEPEFIAVIPTIESALSLVQSRANTAAVEIIREFQENIPQLFANPTQVQQVVINLANNAMDAMEKGGTLSISARGVEENSKRWVEISVKDTGTGMSEEIQSHIFEPFFTTKEVGKGTGLGLGLCYEIVKSAGGTIAFATEAGKGTCFTVRLPVADEGAEKVSTPNFSKP